MKTLPQHWVRNLTVLTVSFCSASCAEDEMLVAFSARAFAGGLEQVWQSVRPVMDIGPDKLDARQVILDLHDADTGQKTGLSLTVTPPRKVKQMVTHQSEDVNRIALFKHNTFHWFDATIPALRETFSFDPESQPWALEIKGLQAGEIIHIEWVFMRFKEGERLVTLVGPKGKTLLNQAHVGSDRKGVYLRSGPFQGPEPLRFTLKPAGDLWPCLPNAIRIVRASP